MNRLIWGTGIYLIIVISLFALSATKFPDNTDTKKRIIGCVPSARFPVIDSLDEITINDNRSTAGRFENGIFYIDLEARPGAWYPETHDGSGLRVYAFAEKGKHIQLPGPLIRVPEGTEIKASITNNIKEHELVLYGFYTRPGDPSDSVVVAPGETHQLHFNAGKAGTYFYRASASDSSFDGLPFFNDSQLYGAFIIDPPDQIPDPSERIFMFGIWNDTLNGPTTNGEELVINGLSWPYTERLNYHRNENVSWRLINASNQVHPMHLHGFFFTLNSKGGAARDFIYQKEMRRKAVTELLHPGETASITWIPEREGNWLFHCHTLVHIMPGSFLRAMPEMNGHEQNDITKHARNEMGGLIMGIHVSPNEKISSSITDEKISERKLTMVIGEEKNYLDTFNGKGFMLLEKGEPVPGKYSIPGPPLILTKDQPVAIKIINKLKEPTTLHWHGLEIESYYDGVPGWGNRGTQLAPMIQPGDSFIVHITPPRAGTYIYHTHMHNLQLLEGMYGPLIVLKPGETFHQNTDKIFLISQGDTDFDRGFFLLNGTDKTDTMRLKNGTKYRFRVINITALGPELNVSLMMNAKPVEWKFIAKDGADLPQQQCAIKQAYKQTISIGETMDFEFEPKQQGDYAFEVRGHLGKLYVTKIIAVH